MNKQRVPREWPTLLLLLAVSAALWTKVPAFRTGLNISTLLKESAVIGIMACGECFVILAGGLDLSVASVLALSSCATAVVLAAGAAWPLAALVGIAAGAAAGGLNGALITYRRLPPILTTLATLLLFRYGASIVTHAKNYSPFPDAFNGIGSGWVPAIIFIVLTGLFIVLTLCTRLGRWNTAIGGSELAARLSAVPVDRVKRIGYILSGVCAALAGLIAMAFNNNTQSTVGQGYELSVIAACVVGGVRITGGEGTVLGAALGAILIALVPNALVLTGRPQEQYGLVTGAVVLAAALIEQWRGRRQSAAVTA